MPRSGSWTGGRRQPALRALILHARTLEVLRPLAVTQALLDRADIAPTADLQLGRQIVRVTLGDLALPDTAFPHLSLIRQMDVEQVLAEALADRGVEVERGTELVSVRRRPRRCTGRPALPRRDRRSLVRFVAGCDGPASTVRTQAGIGWPGRTTRWRSCWPTPNWRRSRRRCRPDRGRAMGWSSRSASASGDMAAARHPQPRVASVTAGPVRTSVPMVEVQALLDAAGLGAQLAELAWSSRVSCNAGWPTGSAGGGYFSPGTPRMRTPPLPARG